VLIHVSVPNSFFVTNVWIDCDLILRPSLLSVVVGHGWVVTMLVVDYCFFHPSTQSIHYRHRVLWNHRHLYSYYPTPCCIACCSILHHSLPLRILNSGNCPSVVAAVPMILKVVAAAKMLAISVVPQTTAHRLTCYVSCRSRRYHPRCETAIVHRASNPTTTVIP